MKTKLDSKTIEVLKKLKNIDNINFLVFVLNECEIFDRYYFYEDYLNLDAPISIDKEVLDKDYQLFYCLDFKFSFLDEMYKEVEKIETDDYFVDNNSKKEALLVIIRNHPNYNVAKGILKAIKD